MPARSARLLASSSRQLPLQLNPPPQIPLNCSARHAGRALLVSHAPTPATLVARSIATFAHVRMARLRRRGGRGQGEGKDRGRWEG
eukprot:4444483-Pyramimonas_sp.AAC.1